MEQDISIKERLQPVVETLQKVPLIGHFFKNYPKVAVIRLAGVIADSTVKRNGLSHQKISDAIEKAFNKGGVKAVALVINSPGGSPAQSSLIANHICQLAEEKELPVYSFIEDVAASGGYWLACAGQEIYGQDTSIVGSIGVISASFGFEDFIEKHNVHRRIYTSGSDKSFLDPFVAEKDADVKRLKALQSDIHAAFKDWVRARRGDRLQGTDKTLFEGQFWTAATALDFGIVDGIHDVRSFMREKYGDEVKFCDFGPDKKFPIPIPGLTAYLKNFNVADDVIEAAEGRSVWGRFGL